MKKFMKNVLIVVLSIALLAGCAGKKQKKETQVNSENITVTAADARESIESLITPANYIATEKEDGTVSYSFKSDLFKDYDLGYILSLDSDTRITLPHNFSEIKNLGWELTNSSYNNLILKPRASTNIICGRNGKEVMMYLSNHTEEELRCIDCAITRVKFDLYLKDGGYKEASATAPDFKIGNSIDNNTDMKGIISEIGQPANITYGIDGDKCSDITLLYQNVSNRDCMKFVLTPDGKKIVSVDYSRD